MHMEAHSRLITHDICQITFTTILITRERGGIARSFLPLLDGDLKPFIAV